ncbi:MAG: extracellular solute-binding protein [Coprobacillus sp.]|nr:extracellular solute-binding protein [Coprobacillus sp.]
MKKGKLVTLCILPLALASLTGCGGGSDSGDIEISFWHTFSYDTQLQNIVDAFEKEYPNIHVTLTKQSTDYSGLKDLVEQGIPANYYPNMTLCYPDHVADYLNTGKVVKLDQFIDDPDIGWSEEDKADVLPNLVATGQNLQVEGTWCLPFAASTEALYYNSDIVIGMDLSNIDATINDGKALDAAYINSLTWEELFNHLLPAVQTYCDNNDIINKSNSYYGIFGYDSDDNLFITLAEQYGYDYTSVNTTTGKGEILFNNDDMKNEMKTFNQAYQNGWFHTKGTAGDNYINTYYTTQGFLFTVGSTGGVKYEIPETNTFTTYCARVPQAEGHEAKQICQGPSICVLDHGSKAENEACWTFYKYLTNTENTLYWALETGYMPIRQSAYTSDDWLELSDASGKTYDDLTYAQIYSLYSDVADSLFTSPAFKGSAEARTQAGSITTQCLLAGENLDSTIDSIFSTAENQAKLAL